MKFPPSLLAHDEPFIKALIDRRFILRKRIDHIESLQDELAILREEDETILKMLHLHGVPAEPANKPKVEKMYASKMREIILEVLTEFPEGATTHQLHKAICGKGHALGYDKMTKELSVAKRMHNLGHDKNKHLWYSPGVLAEAPALINGRRISPRKDSDVINERIKYIKSVIGDKQLQISAIVAATKHTPMPLSKSDVQNIVYRKPWIFTNVRAGRRTYWKVKE
jgi:hypothetical protein